MASLNLSADEYKAVEQTRQRLSHISSSIASLKNDVFASNPFPSLESLQTHAGVLQSMMQSLIDVTSPANELFSRIAVHPSTNFPGRTQEMILLQLLRKKPEPDVATAMDEGRNMAAGLTPSAGTQTSGGKGPEEELETIWDEARDFCADRGKEYVMNEANDMYTEEERENGIENVRTGLKRLLEDGDEDEDEDEEEEEEGKEAEDDDIMIIDRPPPPPAPAVSTQEVEGLALENIMRFAARGEFVPAR